MQLFAAIVPPPVILEELHAAVADVSPRQGSVASREARPPRSHRKESASRLRLRRRPGAAPEPAGHDQLDQIPVDQMAIAVSQFGNLTTADSVRLAEELRREAAGWPRPTLRFTGGAALEWPGDLGVWGRVDGDVETMRAIGRAVPQIAQRLSLFIDRRMFRGWVQVGTITDATTAPYLEELVAALDRFAGTSWEQPDLTLFRGKATDEQGYDEVERIPLAVG